MLNSLKAEDEIAIFMIIAARNKECAERGLRDDLGLFTCDASSERVECEWKIA